MAGRPKAKKQTFPTHKALLRRLVWIVGALACLTIVVQLLYPTDRGLPRAHLQGRPLAMWTYQEMAKAIVDQFDKTKLRLAVGTDKKVEFFLKSAGAEPNTEAMITFLSSYPLWERLIPGSILWQSGDVRTADVYYSGQLFQDFVAARSNELSFPPQNARLAIKKGKLEASEAIAGSQVDDKKLFQAIIQTPIQLGKTTTIQVSSKRTPAARSAKDLAKVRARAEAVLAHKVAISADGKKFSPDAKELASWVVLATDSRGDVSLSIDRAKIKAYLAGLSSKVGTPAGQTDITIVDGREVGRKTGATGRGIAIDPLVEQISDRLLAASRTVNVTAQFVDVLPSVIFNSKYTATQAGLQTYINDVAHDRDMYISIQQLDGEKWSANARADISIPSGSTYKLFVALVLFDKMDKGEIHWDDPMLDTTVAGCFERMTVASTNPCAESWIAQFGRQYINDFVYAHGFSTGTSFTTRPAVQSTAADLTKYMIGLNDGTLVSGAHRERLLDSLGRHPYRYGIPTGSAGVVHDKVGFLWDYVHDTAIVNHPRGTYVMTIMSKGQGYSGVAAVTREIERIMYP